MSSSTDVAADILHLRPIALEASSFAGCPPYDLIEDTADTLILDYHFEGRLDERGGTFMFTPFSYIDGREKELLGQLKTGILETLQYRTLTELDPRTNDPRGWIGRRCGDQVVAMEDGAVSTACLNTLSGDLVANIADHGYSVLKVCPASLGAPSCVQRVR